MRRLWLGLIAFKRLELPVPDTVSSANGQNVMSSYAAQVTREERWAIVNYMRTLK